MLSLSAKQCLSCETRTTTQKWYKSKATEGGDLCRKCYDKELLVMKPKVCYTCGIDKSASRWCRSKVNLGEDMQPLPLCRPCYGKEFVKLRAQAVGKSCEEVPRISNGEGEGNLQVTGNLAANSP